MKKIISLLSIVILSLCSSQMKGQITPYLEQITVNGSSISDCSTIAFGTNSSVNLSLKMRVTKSATNDVGNFATFKLYILKNGSSSPQFINGILINNSAFWNNGTLWEGVFSQTLQASDIDVSGSIFYGVYEVSTDIHPNTCNYSLTKTPPPSFSFTPTSLSLPCGDTSSRTFTVTPANIPSGASVTYQWSYSGWSQISSTSTSKTLQPSSSSSLPSNVSVTPFINGVAQTTQTCTITRSAFTSSASITGNVNLCSGSNTYTISNTGTNTITWSCSNTAIATLNVINPTSVTLTKIGSGSVNLVATLTNSCGQTTTKSKTVFVGGPILPATVFVNGATYTGYNQTLNYSLSGSSINGGTSYQWSVDGPMNDNGGPTCAWQILGGQGTQTVTLKSGCISATVVVRVVATSSCGSSNTKYIYVTVGSDPCPPALRLSQNPIKDGNLVANVIYPPDCDDLLARNANTINNEIKIYDFNGNIVYQSKQNSEELIINNLQLKKGIYLLHVITEKGEIIKDKIIIE